MGNWLYDDIRSVFAKQESIVYILHGNIRDLYCLPSSRGNRFVDLYTLLLEIHSEQFDYFLSYDPAQGIRFPNTSQIPDFQKTVEAYDAYHHTNFAKAIPKEPIKAITLIENFIRFQAFDQKNTVALIDYFEDLCPAEGNYYGIESRYISVSVDKWSRDSFFRKQNIRILLLTENIYNVQPKVIRNNEIHRLYVPLPTFKERQSFLEYRQCPDREIARWAHATSGLTIRQIDKWIRNQSSEPISLIKKRFIESECLGLLDFIEPRHTLSDVVGHAEAVKKLRDIAWAIDRGFYHHLPMGFLITGPVGIGKSHLAKCFAGEIGIPVVYFLNIRSKWVGATEANLEKIIQVLQAIWPVCVVIDEADAFLGTREAQGDSGTQARVFARLLSFMGDTSYRGKIIWFLLTCRPDLLPIDVKRQGRAEEHIALFPPTDLQEKEELFYEMAGKKNIVVKAKKSVRAFLQSKETITGAEIEAFLVRAQFFATLRHREEVDEEILKETLEDFRFPVYDEEMELQILLALKECSSIRLIPPAYRSLSKNMKELDKRIKRLKVLAGLS